MTDRLRTGKTIAEIAEAAGIPLEGIPGDVHAVPSWLETLPKEERTLDGIGFLAHALPRREAVWWAWAIARDSAGAGAPEAVLRSLDATRAWITAPTDENRRAAFEAAQLAEMGTAAGCAGAAAFFSGESLGPPDQAPLPPEEFMAAKAISGCVILAASADPDRMLDALATSLAQGLDVAQKVRLWSSPPDPRLAHHRR